MSTLMLQMAQEMNRRAAGSTGTSAPQGGDQGNQGGNPVDGDAHGREVDSIDAYCILEILDLEKSRIGRIQELVRTILRLALPHP